MLRPRKPGNSISKSFVVVDIENRSTGSLLSIDTFDGKEHTEHLGWGGWVSWLERQAFYHENYRTVYAHNGGGWDYLSLVEWIIEAKPDISISTIENGSKLIALTIEYKSGVSVSLCDSLYLLQTSLDKAASTFIGRGKIKTDHLPEWYWDNDREAYKRYHRNDTEILYETLSAFCDILTTKVCAIGKLGITLPSTAMRVFTSGFLDHEIGIPKCDRLRAVLREGYVGGRVEVFKSGHHKDINVYDFNSLYPAVMRDTNVPVTGTVRRTRTIPSDSECGVFRVVFNQRKHSRPNLLMVGGLGRRTGRGVFFANELRRFVENKLGDLTIEEGWVFTKNAVVFRDYVDKIYALRMCDKDGPLGAVCKLLLNSLYGKFGQKPERHKTLLLSGSVAQEMVQSGHRLSVVNAEAGLYRLTEEKPCHYEHVGIAGTITSEARARLWEKMDSNTVYCDTDSIHTTSLLPHNNRTIGELKLEFSGEGVYAGKKLYALKTDKEEKVRAKGVRLGGDNGFSLGFDGLKSIASGAIVETRFRAPNTPKSVLKGKSACVFVERNRKLRKTANV